MVCKPIYLCLTLCLIDLGCTLERKGFLLALAWHHTGCPGQFKWEGHSTMFPDLEEVQSLGKTDV